MSVLIDPDDFDVSEQQFEASLASAPTTREEALPREERQDEVWNLVAAVAVPPVQQEETSPVDETPYWREEVTSRIENYRARRKRPPRQRSLSLDFERAANRAVVGSQSPDTNEPPAASRQSPVEDRSSGPEQLQPPRVPDVAAPEDARFVMDEEESAAGGRRLATDDCSDDSNIIEFPRLPLVVMPPCGEELAEPVLDRPRILDAPEAVETAQAPLAGIQLEPEEDATPAVEFELPMVVAAMSQRVLAGVMDVLVVALASAAFLMIVVRTGATLPDGKAGPMLLLAAPVLFWAIYEYMFLVHGGSTPGMRMARLQLLSFDGTPVSRRRRRGRALAMVLSCLSLGLGLLWALLDEDTLCWHDRISRTYVVSS